jgi:hypothetical protein
MTVVLLILFTVATGLGSLALISAAVRWANRWEAERRTRNFAKTRLAFRLIPRAQVVIFYLAFGLVLGAFFTWVYAGDQMRTASLVTGATAIIYLGWFSIRWRHLR